jgi:hypothetical protein
VADIKHTGVITSANLAPNLPPPTQAEKDAAMFGGPADLKPLDVSKGASFTDQELYDSLVAEPLVLPNFINLQPSSPDIKFRYVNFSVGEKESGIRYSQMRAAGYVNATLKDIKDFEKFPPEYQQSDGSIRIGDVILMKVDRSKYIGALKWKDDQARRLGRLRGTTGNVRDASGKAGMQSFSQSLQSESGAPPTLLNKVAAFMPDEGDILTK